MADATLWRFDTSLNWGARLLELINGPSISAAELKRILNTDAPGSLRAQLAERLQSIHGERFLWGELCRAMESIEAFDANDLMARIEHEAGRAISTGTNKVPLVKNPGQGKHPWGDDDPDTPCTLDKLAVFLGIPENDKIGRERLRGRLRTWQKNHPRDVVEVENRKPRQAGYLYPIGEVWPSVSDLKSSG